MDQHRFNAAHICGALGRPTGPSSDFDLNPVARPPEATRALREASVLIPLVERGAVLNVVLTRRAAQLRHHPGQIAFPGGKRDADDPTPLDAALREAEEEIGLPRTHVAVLGHLDPHETITGFTVSPFVGLIDGPFAPVRQRSEVDEVFEVPLAVLLDPANLRVHGRRWKGGIRHFYAIPYGPYYIWGATARMLKALGDRVRDP